MQFISEYITIGCGLAPGEPQPRFYSRHRLAAGAVLVGRVGPRDGLPGRYLRPPGAQATGREPNAYGLSSNPTITDHNGLDTMILNRLFLKESHKSSEKNVSCK